MLFSEPKIPQSSRESTGLKGQSRFSALQRAENSSMAFRFAGSPLLFGFQCSSASRKFLNRAARGRYTARQAFQCSSASRKFLNSICSSPHCDYASKVSVLFSEPKIPQSPALRKASTHSPPVSVLFSEPKIPQFDCLARRRAADALVSVLFSEPKIPQYPPPPAGSRYRRTFQCSSASRKFLNKTLTETALSVLRVSVLFSEPKIPQF